LLFSTIFGDNLKTAILTGATGFLGSHIADKLIEDGYHVRATFRKTSNLKWVENKGIELVEQSINGSVKELTNFIGDAEIIIHCAGIISCDSESLYFKINTESTASLLKAARNCPSVESFTLISSVAAVGPSTPGNPITDSSEQNPASPYGRSKLAAENLLKDETLPFRTCALRPPAIYGPRDTSFLPFFKLGQRGLAVKLGNIQELSMVYGTDAANAAVLLATNENARGCYLIDSGKCFSFKDIASAISDTFNRKIKLISIPVWLMKSVAFLLGEKRASKISLLSKYRLLDVQQSAWCCKGEQLNALGFQVTRTLSQGFAETLEYYKDNGFINEA
jgi:nucleoside-diphosphate-sugar epimerase